MKYVLVMAVALTLAACKEDERPTVESDSGRNYRVECVGGVEYWVRHSGHNGYMAVRVDPETLSFVRC
jgi:hypothetical protein